MKDADLSHYVHGYSKREAERLYDQAGSIKSLIHSDTLYPTGSIVLEAGCGVGAQTITLANNNPYVNFIAVDHAQDSLKLAKRAADDFGISNVTFLEADILNLPIAGNYIDHVFVCHILEHLPDPIWALRKLREHMKIGGSITIFEGDHGSCYFYPESYEARLVWSCLIEVQKELGANSLIGRQLFPTLMASQFEKIHVAPKIMYIDKASPDLRESFVEKTIIPMVQGVKARSLNLGLCDEPTWKKGIKDLHQTHATDDGVFSYTFFKGAAQK